MRTKKKTKMKPYFFGTKHIVFICLMCLWGAIHTSCAPATKTFTFACQERQVEIYVEGEYMGRNLVQVTIPRKQQYINIYCQDNGEIVLQKQFEVKDSPGHLIELQIPKNYKYSTNPY